MKNIFNKICYVSAPTNLKLALWVKVKELNHPSERKEKNTQIEQMN